MYSIVNCRIDERLIHGQVAAYWTNTLNATRIMVVDDESSKNEIQKMALKMACPSGIKLSILSVDRAVERLSDTSNYDGERIFVVFKGSETLKEAIFKGIPIDTVTVGNISNKLDSKRVYHTVCVTPKDIENFNMLAKEKNIKFIAQMVPSDEPQDFISLISKI